MSTIHPSLYTPDQYWCVLKLTFIFIICVLRLIRINYLAGKHLWIFIRARASERERARSRECKTYTRGEPQKILPEIAYIEHAFLMENKIKRLKHLGATERSREWVHRGRNSRSSLSRAPSLSLSRRAVKGGSTERPSQQPWTSSLDDGPNEMRWFGEVCLCMSANLCRPVNNGKLSNTWMRIKSHVKSILRNTFRRTRKEIKLILLK